MEDRALDRIEPGCAPIEQRPHVLVAVEPGAVMALQHPEPIGEAGVDLGRAEHVRLGCSELDGEREAVEAPAQRGHRDGVALVDLERRLDGGGPVGEEAHGVGVGDAGDRALPRGRRGQRRQRDDHLAGHAERLPARRQHPQGSGRGEQAVDEVGDVDDDVLAVVEDDHAAQRGAAVEDGGLEPVPGPSRTPIASATADVNERPSVVGVRSTNHTPSGTRSWMSAATSIARRVLPTPPGPVMVTSEPSSSRLTTRRARRPARRSWSASAGADGGPLRRRGARPDLTSRGRPAVSDASAETIARSRSRSSSPGSSPSCSPKIVRARWNVRNASACRPSRCSASISCAHRC